MTTRQIFIAKGFGVNAYARAFHLNQTILSLVLDGKLNGSREVQNGMTRRVILQLLKDEVWQEPLPWVA